MGKYNVIHVDNHVIHYTSFWFAAPIIIAPIVNTTAAVRIAGLRPHLKIVIKDQILFFGRTFAKCIICNKSSLNRKF